MTSDRPVRTRFAPSPSGTLHLGNMRSALFAWAFARHHRGTFILRIEDTDARRSSPKVIETILESLSWLELSPDEGPYLQSERTRRYADTLEQLLDEGNAYRCYMTPTELDQLRVELRVRGLKPRYDGRWRPEPGKTLPPPPNGVFPVIRFKTPSTGSVEWEDVVKGRVKFANSELDDLVIARSDGSPTYNLCVVVDDIDMRISHVIRGDDHVNNTSRQIHLFRALGATPPVFAHLPTILDQVGAKMSKRAGALSVLELRDEGYLPEAVVNFLARLGWAHGDSEIFTRDEFIEWFDLDGVGRSPARFDPAKLAWLNGCYIRSSGDDRLAHLVQPFLSSMDEKSISGNLSDACRLWKDRAATLKMLAESLVSLYRPPELDAKALESKISPRAIPAISTLARELSQCTWTPDAIKTAIATLAYNAQLPISALGAPLRLLITGDLRSPPIERVLAVLPRDLVINRVQRGLVMLGGDIEKSLGEPRSAS